MMFSIIFLFSKYIIQKYNYLNFKYRILEKVLYYQIASVIAIYFYVI